MLADLATATDESLRAAARRLAARIVLDLSRRGNPVSRGLGRLRAARIEDGGDLDIDASLDPIIAARALGLPADLDELVTRQWARPALALCLVVDRSGSMGGERLAAAALVAGACAWRAPGDHAVLTFAKEVDVLRPMGSTRPDAAVVDAILGLRGHGTTSLTAALQAASRELENTRAARRVVVLLSDCRTSEDTDPVAIAARLPELVVLAPEQDCEQAAYFARHSGAGFAAMRGPADAAAALTALLV